MELTTDGLLARTERLSATEASIVSPHTAGAVFRHVATDADIPGICDILADQLRISEAMACWEIAYYLDPDVALRRHGCCHRHGISVSTHSLSGNTAPPPSPGRGGPSADMAAREAPRGTGPQRWPRGLL